MIRTSLLLTLCLLISGIASAFVVEGPRTPAASASEHLDLAPRWGLSLGSMLETGERGLGGGLEYAIDESVCEMRFIDGSTCAQIEQSLRESLDHWASGHPTLNFTDITGKVEPNFPLAALASRGQGAEIDFFGATPRDFPIFANPSTTGYTLFYERPQASMVLTNGVMSEGPIGRIESADVRLNAALCYYIDTNQAVDTCVHFPSLVLHEISHALGIGHPEDNVRYNLDTDRIPGNEIPIDCRAPSKGLIVSFDYDGAALAHGQDVQGAGRWRRGMTWDDVAARDALYPDCRIERIERALPRWGAFALSASGQTGESRLAKTEDEAVAEALASCEETGGSCAVVSRFNGCFAFASNAQGAFGHAQASRSGHARVDAVLACSEAGEDCRVTRDFCAYE
ncbi:MAG: DUF4189 domain-containing protein [Hyphomonadaceae bacterium]